MGESRTFDHTADVGIEVMGKDLADLFSTAGRGMFELITDLDVIPNQEEKEIRVGADEVSGLMRAWLQELLFIFDCDLLILKEYAFVHVDERQIIARCKGGRFDPDVHPADREVKAVTYHGLLTERTESGWRAEIIFDI